MRDYSKLLELLRTQETFPLEYTHKVIGAQTPEFEAGIQALLSRTPALRVSQRRSTGDQAHVSVTLVLTAQTAEEVILLVEASHDLPGIRVIL